MNRFTTKKILITGAASGIGRAAALRIAREGGSLGITDINEKALRALEEELTDGGATVAAEPCDVADFDQCERMVNLLAEKLNGFEGLSHNAGILKCYNTHEMTKEQWNELIAVNLTGTFNVNRHALPHLLKNRSSSLVNTSSIAAYYRHPWMSAYSAAKGGIKSLTRSLFVEYYRQGLRANCVLPGSIDTPLSRSFEVPKGADPELVKTLAPFEKVSMVTPESVAASIAFLLSDDAAHINGTEISVDGGKL